MQRRHYRPIIALVALLLATPLVAQNPSFSVDFQSRSVPGVRLPDEVLVAPAAAVIIPSGAFGLAPSPMTWLIEIDALAQGNDIPLRVNTTGTWLTPADFVFSVDEFATGIPGGAPDVSSEGVVGNMEASADLYTSRPPVWSACTVLAAGNFGTFDGNGIFPFGGPPLGLIEPNFPTFNAVPDRGDTLDAVDWLAVGFPLFFSLDAAYPDPFEAPFANSGTAPANGFSGADILLSFGGFPFIYAPFPALGLLPDDDVDALILWDNGDFLFQAPMMPFDWQFAGTDMLLFSLRRASPTIGMPDSLCGLPIEEGDILMPPIGGAGPPAIFIPAETLGLATVRSGVPTFTGLGDDLDAATTRR